MAAGRLRSGLPLLRKVLAADSVSCSTQRSTALHRALLCPSITNPEVRDVVLFLPLFFLNFNFWFILFLSQIISPNNLLFFNIIRSAQKFIGFISFQIQIWNVGALGFPFQEFNQVRNLYAALDFGCKVIQADLFVCLM